MNKPAEIIRCEIEKCGVLPFARFMELALYYPNGGYYETKISPGRRGDFYTSVSVGELFGQLLAFQFTGWLEELQALKSQPANLKLIEAGAHEGRLAGDILGWLRTQRPTLFEQIEYVILEHSSQRQEWQRETLKPFAPRVRWISAVSELAQRDSAASNPSPGVCGIIFSNELLDAMPVNNYGWDAKKRRWFEWGVTLESEKFVWARMPEVAGDLPFNIQVPTELLDVLPDGYTVEISPAAENWWREAANVLERGWLLTFDYGLTEDEVFSPARTHGTLRAYFEHRVADDILANAGEQDITAHVNFPAIRKVGEDAGLKTEYFGAQAKFLTGMLTKAIKNNFIGGWSEKQTRQFQTLTHPEHLGRAFRVLVQSR